MNMPSNLVKAALAGGGDAFALATVCAIALWAVLRIRRSAEAWSYSKKLPMAIGSATRRRETARRGAPTGNRCLARTSFALGVMVLTLATAYISLKMIPEAYEYAELKRDISRGQQIFRSATWTDPALRCPSGDPLGVHMLQLFDKYQAYVLMTRWDVFPPRYEVSVSGLTKLAHGSAQRRLELDVLVSIGGDATLNGAKLLGEENALNIARQLLIDACLGEHATARPVQ